MQEQDQTEHGPEMLTLSAHSRFTWTLLEQLVMEIPKSGMVRPGIFGNLPVETVAEVKGLGEEYE